MLNEAEALPRVLREIPPDCVDEVIVVDGGSTDDTREVALAAGARVVVEPRRGYGRACLAGVVATDAEVVVFLEPVVATHERAKIAFGQQVFEFCQGAARGFTIQLAPYFFNNAGSQNNGNSFFKRKDQRRHLVASHEGKSAIRATF